MDIEKLRCFIPVGGQGKRLRPLTFDVSKPCVRFLNRPLVEFSMTTLAEQGIRNFIFGEVGYTNYTNLFDKYAEGIGFSAKYNIKPRIHIKHQPNLGDLGSADSFRINMDYYDVHEPVLVVQGDNLFDLNLKDLIKKHEERRALATIALIKVDDVEGYGIAELDGDMRIKRFVEKPPIDEAPSNLANAGIYLLSPEVREIMRNEKVRELIEERGRFDFGFDLIPYLTEAGYPIYGYGLKVWYDIGTPEKYLEAMYDVLHDKLDLQISEERSIADRNIWVQGYSEESIKRREEIVTKYTQGNLIIDGSALIGRHTRIGDASYISDSSIDNFCTISDNVKIERSGVMDAVKIGDHASISDSILGRKAIIESSIKKPTRISNRSVLGNAVQIRKGCKLIGTRVNPGLRIPAGMTYIDKYLQSYEDVVKQAEHQ